jgi:hypothetical protein
MAKEQRLDHNILLHIREPPLDLDEFYPLRLRADLKGGIQRVGYYARVYLDGGMLVRTIRMGRNRCTKCNLPLKLGDRVVSTKSNHMRYKLYHKACYEEMLY